MLLQFLQSQGRMSINDLVIGVVIMIFALMFHNVLQAWVAKRLGDHSPAHLGYLSFDPQRHLNAMGVGLMVVLGLGWPNMVPINGRNYKGKREAIAWYAGPVAYLIVAFVCIFIAVLARYLNAFPVSGSFQFAATYAVYHAVINLFPVYPLDGAKAALAWGNRDVRRLVEQIYGYGFIGFIVIFYLLSFTGILGGISGFFTGLFWQISQGVLGIFF